MLSSPIPNSLHRCALNASSSWKVPSSKRRSSRSRAVNEPLLCCLSILSRPPPSKDLVRSSCKRSLNRAFNAEGSSAADENERNLDEHKDADADADADDAVVVVAVL